MLIKFDKLHGTGNDFILINNLNNNIHLSSNIIENLCDRHFGIGADGLILVEKRDQNYYMNYFNADGSPAEMCGNGMRCTASFIFDHLENSKQLNIDSKVGLIPVKDLGSDINIKLQPAVFGKESVHANPDFSEEDIKKILEDHDLTFQNELGFVSMGNPHCIIIVDSLDLEQIKEIGPKIEKHPFFNQGANVNFVKIKSPEEVDIVTWERGDGITLACGTGTCATISYLNKLGLVNKKVNANLLGGVLELEIEPNFISLTGQAKKVFTGEIEVSDE